MGRAPPANRQLIIIYNSPGFDTAGEGNNTCPTYKIDGYTSRTISNFVSVKHQLLNSPSPRNYKKLKWANGGDRVRDKFFARSDQGEFRCVNWLKVCFWGSGSSIHQGVIGSASELYNRS